MEKVYRFCNEPIYIKTVQYSAPLISPMNDAQALKNKMINMIREAYVQLENSFYHIGGCRET